MTDVFDRIFKGYLMFIIGTVLFGCTVSYGQTLPPSLKFNEPTAAEAHDAQVYNTVWQACIAAGNAAEAEYSMLGSSLVDIEVAQGIEAVRTRMEQHRVSYAKHEKLYWAIVAKVHGLTDGQLKELDDKGTLKNWQVSKTPVLFDLSKPEYKAAVAAMEKERRNPKRPSRSKSKSGKNRKRDQ
jgi:hypothetical protein